MPVKPLRRGGVAGHRGTIAGDQVSDAVTVDVDVRSNRHAETLVGTPALVAGAGLRVHGQVGDGSIGGAAAVYDAEIAALTTEAKIAQLV